jgi:Glycosyltransferase family 87
MLVDPTASSPQAIVATLIATVLAVSRSPLRILPRFTSWPMLSAFLLIAALAVPKIILGNISPCDYLQDTVAAGELLAGRSAYPAQLQPVLKRVVEDHPVPTSISWLRDIQSAHLGCMNAMIVNAHPPLVTIAFEPLVAAMGYYRPILVIQSLTLASIVLMLWLWSKALGIALRHRQWVLFILVLLGSYPILEGLRDGDLSALLSLLVVTVWYLTRSERDAWAGIVLAIAASIKIFPIIACGPLLFSRLKALLIVAASLIGIVLGIIMLQGRYIFTEYAATAHSVIRDFEWLRSNYSLFAQIFYFVHGDEKLLGPVVILVYTLLCATAAAVLLRLRNLRIPCCDFGMAIGATMMCFMSPVVWAHYFIILFLPLCILSHYSKWWESKGPSVAFLLLVASVDIQEGTLRTLSALAGSDAVQSIPSVGVLVLFGWLSFEAFKIPASAGLAIHSSMVADSNAKVT